MSSFIILQFRPAWGKTSWVGNQEKKRTTVPEVYYIRITLYGIIKKILFLAYSGKFFSFEYVGLQSIKGYMNILILDFVMKRSIFIQIKCYLDDYKKRKRSFDIMTFSSKIEPLKIEIERKFGAIQKGCH